MESRKSIRNLFKSIHSLLGLKTHLTSTWAESVCNIIKDLPFEQQASDFQIKCQNFNTMGSSKNKDDRLGSTVSRIQDELEILHDHLNHLNSLRRYALNDLLELKGNIRVFCRIKPMNMMENYKHVEVVVASDSNNVLMKLPQDKSKCYSFDRVFHQDSSQDEVFSEVEPVIKSTLDGYNACIFAYGQTGTGKTFTMEGQPDCPGVVPRAIEALFKQAADSNNTFLFTFSMLEIYMGNLRDLLNPQTTQHTDLVTKSLSIKSDPTGGIEIDNLVSIIVSDFNQAKRLYRLGSRFRSTACTNSNETSSRSHCLIRISLSCSDDPERRRETNKLWMVDLGGSERVLKTKAWGKRLEEGKAINLSLSALGDVINALQRRRSHVPYRNSKLTQILRDCLGEDSKTLMLVHVSPKDEDLCETVCSLGFATRVRSIHLGHAEPNCGAIQNKLIVDDDYTERNDKAKKELAMMNLLQEVKQLEFEIQDVRRDIKKLNEKLEQLARSMSSHDQHSEVSQPHSEVEKVNNQDTTGTYSSKLPRFMRPTICSKKKSGMDHPRKENGQKKGTNHTRRRTSSLRAESITFPIKGGSEYSSEYSISRNSCLAGPKTKYSADYDTDYSYDTSECQTKLTISPNEENLESGFAFSSAQLRQECSGHSDEKKHKIESPEDLAVENWFNLQKNEPDTRTYIYRGKRVLAIPLKGETKTSDIEKAEISHGEEVHDREITENKIFDHHNIKSMGEVRVTPKCNAELMNKNEIIEETIDVCDGFRIEVNTCTPIYRLDMKPDQIFSSSTGISDVSIDDEKSFCEDSPVESLCIKFSPSDARNYLQEESQHCVLKPELESESQCWPLETENEAEYLYSGAREIEQDVQETFVSTRNICKGEENGGLCGSPQYKEDLILPGSPEMRNGRDLPTDQKDANQEERPTVVIESQDKIHKTGVCNLLLQKLHILQSGALLGLGFESLGLGPDFFYALML